MKYIVDVKDISYGRVMVEAESIEEAQEKAEEMYYIGQVPWADCDVSYEARPEYCSPVYYDKNGKEIKDGMQIIFEDGRYEQVFATSDAQGQQDLGISAINDAFLKNHPNHEQEFYSLSTIDLNSVQICSADWENSAANSPRGNNEPKCF